MENSRILVSRDVAVSTRDGTRLATDVYRAEGGERRPALVCRTPYDKSDGWVVSGIFLNPLKAVERGYAVVVQDVRGRFGSEGEWSPFVHEAADGYDTVEWVAEQDWCDSRVGVYGSSYMGVTALQAAVAGPPHLEAAMVYMTGANYHDGWVYSGGAFEFGFSYYWTRMLLWDTVRRVPDPVRRRQLREELSRLPTDLSGLTPQAVSDLVLTTELAPYWNEWLAHPTYDDYWERVDACASIESLAVPLLHVSGWYDNFLRGHLDLNVALKDHPNERVRDTHRMIIGPWSHDTYMSLRMSAAGDRDFGSAATTGLPVLMPLALGWFDRWLRKKEQDDLPRIRFYLTGADSWQEADSWPPKAIPTALYLHSSGRASTDIEDGRLEWDPPETQPADCYVSNANHPVPTRGGRVMSPLYGPAGLRDQRCVEARDDVLVFSSTPLDGAVAVAGSVQVVLYAASDADPTDLAAKLVDVEPNGYCAIIADGIARVTGMDDQQPVRVELWDVAHVFRVGHRIRLEVSSSNFPRFDCAITGGEGGRVRTARRIFHDRSRASHLLLPVADDLTQHELVP